MRCLSAAYCACAVRDRRPRTASPRTPRGSAPPRASLARWPARRRPRSATGRRGQSRSTRGSSVPSSPVYQVTVLAAVPSISAVAVSNGGPATRCGGLPASVLKKSLPAATADAATSSVLASVPRLAVSAACRLVGGRRGVAPIVNSSGPRRRRGGRRQRQVAARAVRQREGELDGVAGARIGAPRSTDIVAGGAPAGAVTVAPAIAVVTPASLKPNGETASSVERRRSRPSARRSPAGRARWRRDRPAGARR